MAYKFNDVVPGINGQVSFDGQFVTIHRTGFVARTTVGKGQKRIPIASIAAVQWKAPTMVFNGFIQFTVPGGNERRSKFGSQTKDAAHDENSVILRVNHGSAMLELRDAIEAAIAGRSAAVTPVIVNAAPISVADELQKLATLREAGVISPDEFDAQKRRLLG